MGEVKPHESSSLPKLPENPPQPPVVSKSHTDSDQEPSPSERSDDTKNPLNCSSETSIPAIGPRNCPGFQNRSPIPELCYHGSSRSLRSLLGRPLRRHQLVRHPRQEGHHYAKRYPIGSTNPRRTSLRNSPSLCKK